MHAKKLIQTRATIQTMALDGKGMKLRARRWRNPIALAVDPKTGTVWAGGAGQDSLPGGHPFEFMDPVSLRPTPADYGWPVCEENHVAYSPGANCSQVVIPAPRISCVLYHSRSSILSIRNCRFSLCISQAVARWFIR